MIFTNKDAQSRFYDPMVEPDIENHTYTKMTCCREILRLTDIFQNDGYIEVNTDDIHVRTEMKDIPEKTLVRTESDIHRLLFHKDEYRKKFERIGLIEPDEEDTYHFAQFLQLCCYLYLLDAYLFYDVRFFDLFRKNNRSADNISGAGTGNEIYQNLILKVILSHGKYKVMDDAYENAFSSFQDAFFGWYETETYREMDLLHDCEHDFLSPEARLTMEDNLRKKIQAETSEMNVCCDQSVFAQVLGTIRRYEAETTLLDMSVNLSKADLQEAQSISNRIMLCTFPDAYEYTYLNKEQIPLLEEDEQFLNCIDEYRSYHDNRRFLNTFMIADAIKKVWEFEEEQLNTYGDTGYYTFLTKMPDGSYGMCMKDALCLAIVRVSISGSTRYFTKRTDLRDRSDGKNSTSHSLKKSFKLKSNAGYNPKESALRTDLFRIIARAACIMAEHGGYEEFMYFEYPMNIFLTEVLAIPEQYSHLEQRIAWFTHMIEMMEKSSKQYLSDHRQ